MEQDVTFYWHRLWHHCATWESIYNDGNSLFIIKSLCVHKFKVINLGHQVSILKVKRWETRIRDFINLSAQIQFLWHSDAYYVLWHVIWTKVTYANVACWQRRQRLHVLEVNVSVLFLDILASTWWVRRHSMPIRDDRQIFILGYVAASGTRNVRNPPGKSFTRSKTDY